MAQNELDGLRNIVESYRADTDAETQHMRDAIRRQIWSTGPPPKLTRYQRAHNRLHWRIRGARTVLAARIAPWLSEDY